MGIVLFTRWTACRCEISAKRGAVGRRGGLAGGAQKERVEGPYVPRGLPMLGRFRR